MKLSIDPGFTETACVPWIDGKPILSLVFRIVPKGPTDQSRLRYLWEELSYHTDQILSLYPEERVEKVTVEDNGSAAGRMQYRDVAKLGRAIQTVICWCLCRRYVCSIQETAADCKEEAARVSRLYGWHLRSKETRHLSQHCKDALYLGFLARFDKKGDER